ncbi:MAG: MarR family winged helix-turn-helix transcriptional regulator [Mycobacterium sp.]
MEELPISVSARASGPLVEYLARLLRSEAESELEAFGLRPRHVIALTVLRELGDQNQADLAETLRIDRTNVVALLNDLEEWQYITRRRTPDDRRRHTVALTAAGRERLAEVDGAIVASESRVLAALDADQQATLHELLQQALGARGSCSEHLPTAEIVADPTN